MDENEECGLSWSGHNIKGDRGSIMVVKDAIHQAGIVPELKDMIKSLQAERDALRKDAERYRHMRTSFARDIKHRLTWYLPALTPMTAEGLDSAIDAAIAAKEPK